MTTANARGKRIWGHPDDLKQLRKELQEAKDSLKAAHERIDKLVQRAGNLECQLKEGLTEEEDSRHRLFNETHKDIDKLQGQVKPLESQLERHVGAIADSQIIANAIVEFLSQNFGNRVIQPGNVTLQDRIHSNLEAFGPYCRENLRGERQ